MKKQTYKTLGILPNTHKRLKSLAGAKGVSMATYLEQVVAFFHRSGADPEDLLQNGENRSLQSIKKQVDFLVRIHKTQETKLLQPLAQSVLSIEHYVSGMLANIQLRCPKCGQDYTQFQWTQEQLSCSQCSFQLSLQVAHGQVSLNPEDVICLLLGGMTRPYQQLKTSEGERTYAFYLDERYRLSAHAL